MTVGLVQPSADTTTLRHQSRSDLLAERLDHRELIFFACSRCSSPLVGLQAACVGSGPSGPGASVMPLTCSLL